MGQRINAYAMGNKTVNALHGVGQSVTNSLLDRSLLELLYFRVSQINGCAFCLDVHSKNLRAWGETEQRLYVIAAWREAPFFSDKERSALAWAEALTKIRNSSVSEEIFAEARAHFSETELVDLTMAIVAINGYNRINLAFGANVGGYRLIQPVSTRIGAIDISHKPWI
jgi:AhpD family alkylhydroperoxidase